MPSQCCPSVVLLCKTFGKLRKPELIESFFVVDKHTFFAQINFLLLHNICVNIRDNLSQSSSTSEGLPTCKKKKKKLSCLKTGNKVNFF